MDLDFNDEELSKIDKVVRDRKFRVNRDDNLYYDNEIDMASVFVKSYKFLKSLENTYKGSDIVNIAPKIRNYLSSYEEIYLNLNKNLSKVNNGVNFGKSMYEEKIREEVTKNYSKVEKFIHQVFPIGRKVETYDPNEAVGVK